MKRNKTNFPIGCTVVYTHPCGDEELFKITDKHVDTDGFTILTSHNGFEMKACEVVLSCRKGSDW